MKQEKLSSLPGARRRELAKDHIVKARGKDALWAGSSPGPWGADLIFYQRSTERWTRVWVDHGEVSVEAAPFVGSDLTPPGANVDNLIITTTPDRAAMINVQLLALNKSARGRVSIFCS